MSISANDPRVSSGILTMRQAALLLERPGATIRSWARPTVTRPSLVHTVDAKHRGWPTISLVGLAEASSLNALRNMSISMPTVIRAAEFIREHWRDPYALANPNLVTDGIELFFHDSRSDEIFRIRDRQHAFIDVLRDSLSPVILGSDGYAKAYTLPVPELDLTIDPRFNSGRPSFANKVPAFAVVGSLRAGESSVEVAAQYGLPPTQVMAVERNLDWLELAA